MQFDFFLRHQFSKFLVSDYGQLCKDSTEAKNIFVISLFTRFSFDEGPKQIILKELEAKITFIVVARKNTKGNQS